jgi:hypothetical protein
MRKQTRLYDVVFPVWLILLHPLVGIPAYAINYFVDFFVLKFSLRRQGIAVEGKRLWGLTFALSLIGFGSDILGVVVLFTLHTGVAYLIPNYNPWFSSIGLLVTGLAVVCTGVLIFFFDRVYLSRRLQIDRRLAGKVALSFAIITAPYLFLLPPIV